MQTLCIRTVIPPYFAKESIQKWRCFFCDDHRNNVLLWLKFDFMSFKSQNDCICGTPTSPPSRPTHNFTPPFAKWRQFGTQKFIMTCFRLVIYVRHHIDVLGPMYCLPWLVVPIVVFQSFMKRTTAQIHSVLVALQDMLRIENLTILIHRWLPLW
jgi:hypothetical protein